MEKSKNTNLHAAKRAQNDEFYTQWDDIQKEMNNYFQIHTVPDETDFNHFEGKVVYCNCDDPYESNFFKFFAVNFKYLKLKQLIATCYIDSPISNKELCLFDYETKKNKTTTAPHKIVINELKEEYKGAGTGLKDIVNSLTKNNKNTLTKLKYNGDFRNEESIEILKKADIVVTNPPFSLFREYVAQLMEYKKQFIIIGSMNAIKYKVVFPQIMNNKIWLGVNWVRNFIKTDASMSNMGNVCWYTNIPHHKRASKIGLDIDRCKYTPEKYPKYDNYDAIEVSKVKEIPPDYNGVMGVPISFLDKYNPEQFEIIGLFSNKRPDSEGLIAGSRTDLPEHKMVGFVGPVLNGRATYDRILIRRRQ